MEWVKFALEESAIKYAKVATELLGRGPRSQRIIGVITTYDGMFAVRKFGNIEHNGTEVDSISQPIEIL